jgi:hypothetical protein
MTPPPASIDRARVLAYTFVDSRHVSTGRARHFVGGALAPVPSGLAICRYDNDSEGFYLFGCDQAWATITDTWHATIDEAKAQAEFEHAGTMDTWIHWES